MLKRKTSKLIWTMGIVLAFFLCQSTVLQAASDSKAEPSSEVAVIIDGRLASLDRAPILVKGTTLVPFRPIFEQLGLEVKWDPKAQAVTGKSQSLEIRLVIGNSYATVNGKKVKLPVAPIIRDGGTFVPLRFVGEAAGRQVTWNDAAKVITVNLMGADKIYDPYGLLLYEGDIVNGIAEGKGTIYYPNGSPLYKGDMLNGAMHGKGKLYREDGLIWYESDFVDDEATGKGKLYFYIQYDDTPEIKQTYEGDLVGGIPEGKGKYFDSKGRIAYEGDLVDGNPGGKGTYYYPDGMKMYVGECKNGKYEGQGINYYDNGKIKHEGSFKEFLRHGYGKTYDRSGNLVYEGDFINDKYDGQGTLYDENGKILHKGQFSKGEPVTN
ncbi:stalk domain-containing protein [Paenibacillus sp. KQZ6P-2]|uniref:Stalk domain-containing protein n=1 Tax=Paenibacillus mangrovi TaxID=2931978 RepID=A0A9X1WMU1_9BACL|nr:stalk domain-containing protein [Paenibacillus mangrovi]MCJ8010735.1 stalk domain-containing protein [Paenibacillus mangrovi]